MTDYVSDWHATFADGYYGVETSHKPKRPYVYSGHGSGRYVHLSAQVVLEWHRGRLIRSHARAACGASIWSERLAARPPDGMTPCARCLSTLSPEDVLANAGAR